MTNEEKIRELALYNHMPCDWFEEALYDMAEWKDKQFKEDIHQFCRYCESKMPKFKACAFRSLSNEYCDFIEDMFKKY